MAAESFLDVDDLAGEENYLSHEEDGDLDDTKSNSKPNLER